jgi:hypothetical protein
MTADHLIYTIQNMLTRAQRYVWISRISTVTRIVVVKVGQPPVVNIIFNPPKHHLTHPPALPGNAKG